MNYKENAAKIRQGIIDEFGQDRKLQLAAQLNNLLKYHRLQFKKIIEDNLDKI